MAGASAELAAIAARLKATGQKGLRTELLRGLKTGAAPLIPAVQDAARNQLPKFGGLNEQVAGQKVSVSVRMGARNAGIRLTTTAPDTAQTDAGWVRHPVFARSYSMATGQRVASGSASSHRNAHARSKTKWVTQQIPRAAGWWSKTLEDHSPEVTPDLLAEMARVADLIQGV